MTLRRRLSTLIVVACTGLGGFATSAAMAPGEVRVPAPVERVHRFYAAGPSAQYSGDAGATGSVLPLVWNVSGETTRSAVVEASFEYVTKGEGPFVVGLGVRQLEGPDVRVRPEELTLPAAPDGATTTVRFLVPELPGGHSYEAFISVNSVFVGVRGSNRIGTRKLLMTVEMSDR